MTLLFFDRKGDCTDCTTLAAAGLPLFVILWHELQIAMLQPVGRLAYFCNVFVEMLASHLHLMASRRLLLETLQLLYQRQRPIGTWPTLSEWISTIDKIRVNSVSRLGQYREAALYALRGVQNELGDVVSYVRSDIVEKMLATPGVFVIQTSGLSVDVASLLTGLIVNIAYETRGLQGANIHDPLLIVLDDALPLVHGHLTAESEGGTNPLNTWSFMARSRGMGFIVSAQNFSLISPALRNNADTILCFGSYGRDAEELSRHLHLTPEQASLLPQIRPGGVVAIARNVWPLAIYGQVPKVE